MTYRRRPARDGRAASARRRQPCPARPSPSPRRSGRPTHPAPGRRAADRPELGLEHHPAVLDPGERPPGVDQLRDPGCGTPAAVTGQRRDPDLLGEHRDRRRASRRRAPPAGPAEPADRRRRADRVSRHQRLPRRAPRAPRPSWVEQLPQGRTSRPGRRWTSSAALPAGRARRRPHRGRGASTGTRLAPAKHIALELAVVEPSPTARRRYATGRARPCRTREATKTCCDRIAGQTALDRGVTVVTGRAARAATESASTAILPD